MESLKNNKVEKREIVSSKAQEKIREIRSIFRDSDTDVLLFGSRAKRLHTDTSDYDVAVRRFYNGDLDDDQIKSEYKKLIQEIEKRLRESFTERYNYKTYSFSHKIDTGDEITVLPKISSRKDPGVFMMVNTSGEVIRNTLISQIKEVKRLNKESGDNYRRIVVWLKDELGFLGISGGGTIIESLTREALEVLPDRVSLTPDTKRIILEKMSDDLSSYDGYGLHTVGDQENAIRSDKELVLARAFIAGMLMKYSEK